MVFAGQSLRLARSHFRIVMSSRHIAAEGAAGGANQSPAQSHDVAPVAAPDFTHALVSPPRLSFFSALTAAQNGLSFDACLTSMQNLFSRSIAKVTSLIAVVIVGYSSRTASPAQGRLTPPQHSRATA